jgi:hypothetical protein
MRIIFLVSILISLSAQASRPELLGQKQVNYRTYFGDCPSKSSGNFAMLVIKEFEKNQSLKQVKEKILSEKLDEKHFLSDYKISYNPVINNLKIKLECPEPLARVQVYKSNGEEHFSAILAANSKTYDPAYENLIKAEKKLTSPLPNMVISMDQLEGEIVFQLTGFIQLMDKDLRHQISEIIISKSNDLTIIFSLGRKATSVFMGADFWEEKLTKLSKIVGYVSKNKRYPSSINLVNAKKVVVKFTDSI